MDKLIGLVSANYSIGDFGLITADRPIASIPFGGRYRLIDFPISNMVNAGITTVGVITPHWYRSILDHIGNGKPWNLNRKNGGLFILPGSTYGYDVGKNKFTIRDIIGNKEFINRSIEDYVVISACNKIFNIDYLDVLESHKKSGASCTICYYETNEIIRSNETAVILDENDNVSAIKKLKKNGKAKTAFMDTLIMNKDLLIKIMSWYKDQNYRDLVDILEENLNHIVIHGYNFRGYVKNLFDVSDYMKANQELLNEDVLKELFMGDRMIYTKIHDYHPVKYGKNAVVKNSIISIGSKVYGKVSDSIIFRDCEIAPTATVSNCVIMKKTKVPENAVLENVICDKNASLAEGIEIRGTKEKPIIITRNQYK